MCVQLLEVRFAFLIYFFFTLRHCLRYAIRVWKMNLNIGASDLVIDEV